MSSSLNAATRALPVLLLALLAGRVTPALAQPDGERRGFFGLSLSCEECFVERAPGRIAYTRNPAVISAGTSGAAYIGGLRVGDTLVAVNGMPLMSVEGFAAFAEAPAGRALRLTIRRAGETVEVTVVPAATSQAVTAAEYYNSRLRLARRQGLAALRRTFRTPVGWIGAMLDCRVCTPSTATTPRTWVFRTPPVVLSIEADGPAHRAGLQRGDSILAVDDTPITRPLAGRTLANLEPGQRVVLTWRREGRERRATLIAEPRSDVRAEELAAFEGYRRLRDSLAARRTREVAEVQVAPALVRAAPGEALSFTATVFDSDGQPLDAPVQWVSNNINVIAVSPNGTARAVAPGVAIVRATAMSEGRAHGGQATVFVGRDGAAPGAPAPPRRPFPGPVVATPTDSLVRASIDCSDPLINSINPLRACWDRGPQALNRTDVRPPRSCPNARPSRVLVLVTETGSVGDARLLAPSGCQEYDELVIAEVRRLQFRAATQGGRPVRAWMQASVGPRPADPKAIPEP